MSTQVQHSAGCLPPPPTRIYSLSAVHLLAALLPQKTIKMTENNKQSKSLTLMLQKACLYRHPNYSLCRPRCQAGVKLPAHLSVAVPKSKQICLQDLQAKPYAIASRTRNWHAYLDRLSKHLAC